MKEVQTLLPHRDPFLYVDKLVSITPETIVGTKIFSDTDQFLRGSFPDFYFVPGMILIEAMAQCGGAGIKKLALTEGLFGLANIENATFYRGVEYEKEFRMEISNLKITERYIRQSGLGLVDGERCVELSWTCVRLQ
jgi:3-hydroxyacyl-[acyl-carrier-protein] dehydratase